MEVRSTVIVLKGKIMETPMLGLRTVVYRVADLQAAKKWYQDAFLIEPYFDQPFYIGFNVGGYELGLLPGETADRTDAQNVSCYWGVDDIEGEIARLIELGASAHEAPANVGGPIVVGSVRDPWGNVLGLIYNPTFVLP